MSSTICTRSTDNERLRLKCRVSGDAAEIDSVYPVWRAANWYEREVFDLFGIRFRNHPNLTRIMMPDDWEGHPLRKDFPVHGHKYSYKDESKMSDTRLHAPPRPAADPDDRTDAAARRRMTLNMGPQHPSTHGVLRVVLELDGETIVKAEPDIGFLHTGIEKQCEAQNWQQVVPLTDRVDYLANLSNNLCYCLAVEKLLGIGDAAQGAVDARAADAS